MKITIVGVILIAAGVMAGVLLLLALNQSKNGIDNQIDISDQDQSLQNRTNA